MAFFEDLGKKISDVSQSTMQKGKDFAEVQKLNSSISDEQKKINEALMQIGKLYYSKYKDNADADMVQYINAITEGEAKIEDYKKQIVVIKGVKPCPQCGADVTSTAAFCNSCGAKITAPETTTEAPAPVAEAPTEEAPATVFCTNCGAKLNAGAAFCTSCGTKLS